MFLIFDFQHIIPYLLGWSGWILQYNFTLKITSEFNNDRLPRNDPVGWQTNSYCEEWSAFTNMLKIYSLQYIHQLQDAIIYIHKILSLSKWQWKDGWMGWRQTSSTQIRFNINSDWTYSNWSICDVLAGRKRLNYSELG